MCSIGTTSTRPDTERRWTGKSGHAWITTPAGANTPGSIWSQRFMTDAPVFELKLGDWNGASNFLVTVDGQPVSRGQQITFPNAGGT